MSSAGELVSSLLSTPPGMLVTFIQFVLGLALGYVFIRALKYILAFIGILVLGSALSIWSLQALPGEIMEKLRLSLDTLKTLLLAFTALLVGPVSVGFIIGAIIGLLKK